MPCVRLIPKRESIYNGRELFIRQKIKYVCMCGTCVFKLKDPNQR